MKSYNTSSLNKVVRGSKRATYDVQKINAILDAGFIGHIGYIYENKAISIPMAYCRVDDSIYLHGSRKNRMLLSLLKAKETCMTVMHLDGLVLARSGLHHSVNYRSVTLFGALEQIKDPTEKKLALKHVVNQMVPDRWESLRPMKEKELNATLVVKLKIETASAKIRSEGVIDEKEDYDLPVWAGVIPIKQVAKPPISDEALPKDITKPKHVLDYYKANKA